MKENTDREIAPRKHRRIHTHTILRFSLLFRRISPGLYGEKHDEMRALFNHHRKSRRKNASLGTKKSVPKPSQIPVKKGEKKKTMRNVPKNV